AADHLKVASLGGLKRGEASPPLSAAGVDAVFRTAKDAAGKADGAQPGEQIVFRVTDIVVPSLDMASDEGKRAVHTLNRGLPEAFPAEYIAWPERDIGVTTNKSALSQVVSGGAGDGTNCPRNADRAASDRVCQALRARRGSGRVDHTGVRPRNPGIRLS